MKKIKTSLVLLFLIIFSQLGLAQDIPSPMSPPRLVNDFANIFKPAQTQELESYLRAYHDSTSTQIYVVCVESLNGMAPSDFATELGEKWGVGQKGKDNGAVILIKPRIGNERGQVYISVGYGLEPILTDGRIGQIIDNYMMPHLAQGDYYSASFSAAQVMVAMLSGEFKADPQDDTAAIIAQIVLLIGIFVFMYFISKSNKNGGNSGSSGGRGGRTIFFPMGGGSRGGGFGGGFGGGGGGSFGGGGAGRSF